MEGIDILRQIGRGSYGSVWLARRQSDDRNLVLKSVDLSHLTSEQEESARQEVHILAGLKHPNIVSYKESFEQDHHLYLLMTYCEGGDLFTKIRHQNGALIPEQQIVRWLIQITMALQYLHGHSILHRDLKTQNIFLTRSGLVKLGDFGIAKVLNSSLDMATTLIGTPYYMSPELFAGIPYSYKSDIWSLGCCLYELTTLKHAFQAHDIAALVCRITRGKVDGIPPGYTFDLKDLINSLMSHTPDLRPSASQVLQKSFIREHIASFLKDTTNVGRQDVDSDRGCKPGGKHNSSDARDCEDKHLECAKHHVHARRHCEILPLEFESLQISGDRIKLEDRAKLEHKPNGVKECNCERKNRRNEPFVSHVGSKSRMRRRMVKDLNDLKDPVLSIQNEGPCNASLQETEGLVCGSRSEVESETRICLSLARERRLKKKSQEMELETFQEADERRHSVGCGSNTFEGKVEHKSEPEDSSETDSLRQCTIAYKEDISMKLEGNDLANMLNITLTESSQVRTNEHNVESTIGGESTMNLQSRLLLLEENLLRAVGEDQFANIISLLKSGSWDEWEEQCENLSGILGKETFTSVSIILCHLKLCYCFLQD
ncbi:Serine/threonine-protein kinase Nek4 [Halocaridina rubra]|uniref:non-specific serine/threonine protein kinase n=1 Tax=Halocaridina rubra TaxID=373956 RepID=A0AAN8WNP7_HALRR